METIIMLKLDESRYNGKEIDNVTSKLFRRAYLKMLFRVISIGDVNWQTDLPALILHVQPFSITQFAEQPSPLLLLPSSHWYFITTPSPQI